MIVAALIALGIGAASAGEYGPSAEGEWVVAEMETPEDSGTGGCSDLYLKDGVQLPDLPLFYSRIVPEATWGTQELVDLLVESTRHVRWLMPESSTIVIGDLSTRYGGFLQGHKSHRGGVDADVGIFRKGAYQAPNHFDDLSPSEFDAEANWVLISTMLQTGKVDMILLDRSLIQTLRSYTLKAGLLTVEEADRIFIPDGGSNSWGRSGVVRHAPGHRSHLHVRVLCSDGSKSGN